MRGISLALLLAALVSAAAFPRAAGAAPPLVRAAAQPSDPRFGDSFDYVVTVEVDPAAADEVEVGDGVGPFTTVGPTRSVRSDRGGRARLTVTRRLACLTLRCLPKSPSDPVVFPAARVEVAGAVVPTSPLALRVRTRAPAAAVRAAKPVFRRTEPLPPLSARVRPDAAAAGLVVAGVLLVLVGVGSLVLRFRRRDPVRGTPAGQDALARAVRLLRESQGRDASDRRRAAGLVSRVLGESDLSGQAARVAWSREPPGPPDVTELASTVERAGSAQR